MMNRFANTLIAEGSWPRERLDVDYNARATVGDRFPDEMRAYRETSDEVRGDWLRFGDIVYDDESQQTLDIFGPRPDTAPRPVFLFVHGGYWRALSKYDSAMMAGMLAKAGIMTAVVDYRLAPTVSLSQIVREVRTALAFLWRNADRYGIDRDRIHIGGSSAGGHLTGMLLAGGWHQDFGVPENLVKSALPMSGLFELAPLAASFPQEWLSLDEQQIDSLSPIRHLPRRGCPVLVAWAEKEAPGFKRQSAAFAEAWKDLGHPVQTLEVPERNHFDILMELRNEETALSQALLTMVGG
ncbi:MULTISPECIES: alpha/beta hydrolase [unclassified Rhizobium]|jgi:arylformamidase|uniref:alpha/beta hydrolase n=1 Tax=unclassified Rhizobium TaxID=2613769 RepID=UPI0007C66354|nr:MULTISPECIES: alpha/beta hydrolase [unclassified Rhizobium]OJY68061.1 MAG: alpha/beta hydrolase [Rhizobium sp. 60-20]